MHAHPRQQRGFTLIEALVAMFVTALGIMGIVGLQMRTLADTQTSVRRAQAIRLIEDLGERMRVQPNALASLGDYVSGFSDEPAEQSCTDGCNRADLAKHDLWTWKQTVKASLPLGEASTFIAPAELGITDNRRQLGVIIAWRENERAGADDDFKAAIDAVASAGGTDAGNACPDSFTCHLQYIPVAARCAPYSAGGTVQYFCPGP